MLFHLLADVLCREGLARMVCPPAEEAAVLRVLWAPGPRERMAWRQWLGGWVPGPHWSLVPTCPWSPPHVSWALGCKGSLPDSPSLRLGAWRLILSPQISWAAWTCSMCLCSGALNTPVHAASKFGLRQQVDAWAQRGSSDWHGTCWHRNSTDTSGEEGCRLCSVP